MAFCGAPFLSASCPLTNNVYSLLGASAAPTFFFVSSAETLIAVMDKATMTRRRAKQYRADRTFLIFVLLLFSVGRAVRVTSRQAVALSTRSGHLIPLRPLILGA